MILTYRACDRSGREFADTIEASDFDSATEMLRRRQLYVIDISEGTASRAKITSKPSKPTKRLGYTRRLRELALFSRQLSVLVSSGTPLVEALGAMRRQLKEGPWQETVSSVRARVEEGTALCEAMEVHPDYFDSSYCSLIAAGESSGDLPGMLNRLACFKQKQLHVRNSVVGAMIYPCLLMVMATCVLATLLAFVVPRFAGLFETLDVPLPASTKALLFVSVSFRSYWWAIMLVVAAAAIALRAWWRTPGGQLVRDTAVLRLPQIGRIIKNFAMARITRLLGLLLEGHVPVLEALRLTRDVVSNTNYRRLVSNAEDLVSRGEPLSSAFADTEIISPSVYEAIRNGEKSGKLGTLLLDIADFLDDENEITVRSLTSILEPVILVFMGLLVGVVAISLFMPLFDLTAMVQGGGA